jgi:predicted amidophosphoribosyltransferase
MKSVQAKDARIAVVRPLLDDPRVCSLCRGPTRASSRYCWCCSKVCSLLGANPRSMPRVIPVHVFVPGDNWNVSLRRYKDAPVVAARRYFTKLLASELETFLAAHGDCLDEGTGGFEAWCVVPTSRPGSRATSPHPLESVLAGVGALSRFDLVRLLPIKPTHHLQPTTGAFVPADLKAVSHRRVLLVDDSWVTGARALSAVVALRSAGAKVAGVLVLGRSVDPTASSFSRSWWAAYDSTRSGVVRESGTGPCSDRCLVASACRL